MEAWSEWLLQSLVRRSSSLAWCTRGELMALMQDEPQSGAWWTAQLSDASASVLRLIQLANSAAYASRTPATTLEEAIEVLGHTTARHLLFQELLERRYPARGKEWILWAPRWRHVLAVSAVSGVLARKLKLSVGEVFVAALLHDLGQNVLLRHGGEPYTRLEATFGADPDPMALNKAELEHLGFDSSQLGAAIAAHWGLPSSVVSMVRDHGRLDALRSTINPGSHLSRVAVLELAEAFATALGYGPQGPDAAVEGRKGWMKKLLELSTSPANQVLKLNWMELWLLRKKVEVQVQSVMQVARGGEGSLWEGPGLVERLSRSAQELRGRVRERWTQLRPLLPAGLGQTGERHPLPKALTAALAATSGTGATVSGAESRQG